MEQLPRAPDRPQAADARVFGRCEAIRRQGHTRTRMSLLRTLILCLPGLLLVVLAGAGCATLSDAAATNPLTGRPTESSRDDDEENRSLTWSDFSIDNIGQDVQAGHRPRPESRAGQAALCRGRRRVSPGRRSRKGPSASACSSRPRTSSPRRPTAGPTRPWPWTAISWPARRCSSPTTTPPPTSTTNSSSRRFPTTATSTSSISGGIRSPSTGSKSTAQNPGRAVLRQLHRQNAALEGRPRQRPAGVRQDSRR